MRTNRQKAPLRRIVERTVEYIQAGDVSVPRPVEVLECGHRQRPVQDIYGETNAYRRRCLECAKASGS
jgi:hypothetical protein